MWVCLCVGVEGVYVHVPMNEPAVCPVTLQDSVDRLRGRPVGVPRAAGDGEPRAGRLHPLPPHVLHQHLPGRRGSHPLPLA